MNWLIGECTILANEPEQMLAFAIRDAQEIGLDLVDHNSRACGTPAKNVDDSMVIVPMTIDSRDGKPKFPINAPIPRSRRETRSITAPYIYHVRSPNPPDHAPLELQARCASP